MLSQNQVILFRKKIYHYFFRNARAFAWRETTNPYHILVSEVMLQQTQVQRVVVKYQEFIERFPHFFSLAAAQLTDVLHVWQGLGYNRRGLFLHSLATIVVQKYDGELAGDVAVLQTLPGIGYATACSIAAFAYNIPTVFIETNIRSVYLHEFFQQQRDYIHDRDIFPFVEKTLDRENPRQWYYALMDYGVMLKQTYKNPSRQSLHHTAQSRFKGSQRQVRGAIIRALTNKGGKMQKTDLLKILGNYPQVQTGDICVHAVLFQLQIEGFVDQCKDFIIIRERKMAAPT